ncbi:hypothetical protein SAMN06297422_13214 [Lachnospiraceae bacterium]|nr:hypothetical protein SAMN06297422_13214 [Lachnospiraceae bacterium]
MKTKSNHKKWFQLKHTKINHPRNGYEKEYLAAREWCENQQMQDWYIRSIDGLKLHAFYLPADNPKRIILLSHGYKGTSFGSIAHMAEFLHENDSSLLFVDQRCCGKSEGKYITFGAKEQYDILAWIRRISRINKERLPIYLYGQSMGAATVLLAAGHKLPEEVKGIIADCGFHSLKQQLKDIAKGWFHLHWIGLLLIRVDILCRYYAGFRMQDTDTTRALLKNKRPILFFHGKEDTYVWPKNTIINYEKCTAPKELVLVPGARHLCSSFVAPELYKKKLIEFFEDNDK